MAYPQLLKDPRWQKKRLEVMSRDNFSCQYCKSTDKTLNVHHFSYDGDPWDVDLECLITLCEDCHSLETYFTKTNPTLQKASSMSNVLVTEIIDLLAAALGYRDRQQVIELTKTITQNAETIY